VELDTVSDGKAMPSQREIVIVGDSFVRTETQRRRQRQSDFPLQRVTGDLTHLGFDGLETLAFALPDLDGEQLEQMSIPVGSTGAGAFGSIE
jgi:hypothetical protein